jgi:hypothetical protein
VNRVCDSVKSVARGFEMELRDENAMTWSGRGAWNCRLVEAFPGTADVCKTQLASSRRDSKRTYLIRDPRSHLSADRRDTETYCPARFLPFLPILFLESRRL